MVLDAPVAPPEVTPADDVGFVFELMPDEFKRGMKIAKLGLPTGATLMPMFRSVLFETVDADTVRLTAYDMLCRVSVRLAAKVTASGSLLLHGATIHEVADLLREDQSVTFRIVQPLLSFTAAVEQHKLFVTNVKGLDPSEYPQPLLITSEGKQPTLSVNAIAFQSALKSVLFAAATEGGRPVLEGVEMVIDKDIMTLNAADGYRMATYRMEIDTPLETPIALNVHRLMLADVLSVLPDDLAEDRQIHIFVEGEHVLFQFGGIELSSVMVSGQYPAVASIIPKDDGLEVTCHRTDLLKACKRVRVFARDSNNAIHFESKHSINPGEPGELKLWGKSAERGDATAFVDSSVTGIVAKAEVSASVELLIDALAAWTSDKVVIRMSSARVPLVLTPAGKSTALYVVMPMSKS